MENYRQSSPQEDGFLDAQDEFEAMRDYAQKLLTHTDPHDIMDTLLMIANVCESRALQSECVPFLAEWYLNMANTMRAVMETLSTPFALPNEKLENPELYFPDMDHES